MGIRGSYNPASRQTYRAVASPFVVAGRADEIEDSILPVEIARERGQRRDVLCGS